MVAGQRTGHCRDGPALSRGALPNQDTDSGWLGTGGGCRVQLRGGFSQGRGLRSAAVPGEEPAVCGQVCVCVCVCVYLCVCVRACVCIILMYY